MKEVKVKIYEFNELSQTVKNNLIESERANIDTSYIYDEAHNTVKKFHEIFGTKEGHRSWLDCSASHIDDNILNLKGLRLRTYIINNFWRYIYKGKYFSLWSKTDVSYKYYKDGHPVLKSIHSKVLFDNTCTLTGVCYDNSLLAPIYEFIEEYKELKHSNTTFDGLIDDCFYSLKKDLENEADAMRKDEYIIEEIQNESNMYLMDGTIFNQ